MTIANVVHTKAGKVRPVCEWCGKLGRAVEADPRFGEPGIFALANGWSMAPYGPNFEHDDGSRGSLYTCPSCAVAPLPREPHPDRMAARAERAARAR